MKTRTLRQNKVNVVTLGCAKNIFDSEVMMAQLKANAFEVEHESADRDAEIVIVNTCGFIDNAKEESINTILAWAKEKEKGNVHKLYVTGCLSERYKPELATAGIGEVWETGRVAIKPIPACHLVHACADAAVYLAKQHQLKPADIASIQALVPKEAYAVVCEPVARRRRPESSYAAQFSLHYAVACGIACGRFSLAEMEPAFYTRPDILALVDKVEHDEYPGSEYPRYFSGEVRIRTTDGRELVAREHINRGAADRPISGEDIVKKFMDNALMAVPRDHAEKLRDAVLAVDRCSDLATLEDLFAAN